MSCYNGSLTREQFMFNELRVVARLYRSGMDNQEITQRVFCENLFQYPTEREIRGKCRVALRRLGYIACSDVLLTLLTEGSASEARQVALVAMMNDSLLLSEFMVNVVGEKYRQLDCTLTRKDINLFFAQLAEKDEGVASWSEATVKKIKSVITNVLRENQYLSGIGSEELLPVLVSDEFVSALKSAGMRRFLPAFNVQN